MAEFKTPTAKRVRSRITDNPELQTPIKIPASPFLKQIGYGTGINVFTLERSPRVGFARSPWAIKKRNKNLIKDARYISRLQTEAETLKKLTHPNIVGFRGVTYEAPGEPCLIMEKLDISLGDLIEEKIEAGELQFSAKEILKVGFEVSKGLEYLHHTAFLLHGDMKSFNVLVSRDLNIVKICDFGVSIPLTKNLEIDSTSGLSYIGTQCWSAPEVLNDEGPITNKADIWSYGLVIWEMIALSPPHLDSGEDHSMDISDDSMLECKSINDTQDSISSEMEDSFLNSLKDPDDSKYGTRPPLPAIELGPEYDKVLEIFFACTDEDYKTRPSAKGVVMFYKNYVKNIAA